jgi:hypothetical protein
LDVAPDVVTVASEPKPQAPSSASASPATSAAPDTTASSASAKGLPPVVFWLGVGATSALTGATIASGVDSNARYDDFAAARTIETRDSGQASELRTNVLLGTTIVAALATTAIGLWFTRWGGSAERR